MIRLSTLSRRLERGQKIVHDTGGLNMWVALVTAVGLMLVIEGIMPFINPRGFKRTLSAVTQAHDRVLRIAGIASMIVGVILLYLARMFL